MRPVFYSLLCVLWTAELHAQTIEDGIAMVEADRFEDAVRILASVVERNPESFEGNFYLGLAHFRAGRPKPARPLLERATGIAPANPQAWKMLGLVSTSDGDFQTATSALAKACDLAPNDDEACYYLARNLYALGRFEAARIPFEKALRAAPESMQGRVHRAMAMNLAATGSPTEAELHFVKAIQLAGRPLREPDDARIDYGAFLFRQGRTDDALRPLQQAAQDMPSSARANLELGRVLLHLDRIDAAATSLAKAVRLQPGNSNAHLLLSRAYLRLGRISEGEREMRLAQEALADKH
jgi:protein O-GlcNAc transferase